jgi:membrane protein implicated in regulation of membrane protease activity
MPSRDTWKYLALQVAGWWLLALALLWVHALAGLPLWAAGALLALFIAKDLLLIPVLDRVRHRPAASTTIPVGARGTAVERLDPRGYVRVNGELWKAETPSAAIPAGAPIAVREAHGFTLIVEAVAACENRPP